MDIKKFIRDIPDFPKKGIIFKDITPLLKDKDAFRETIDQLCDKVKDLDFDLIIAPEARGFILGAAMAYRLGKGFVPVRKPGKLPYKTVYEEFQLEYGTDQLHIHIDAVERGQNVLIVDDVLATGGTAKTLANLVEKVGGNVSGMIFLIELSFLNAREKLQNYWVESLIKY